MHWVTEADAQALWELPARHPLAAALRHSFKRFRLEGTLLIWRAEAVADHTGGAWLPAQEGLADTLRWLRGRWRALAAQAVAARRPHFWEARLGIDWVAAERVLSTSGLSPSRQAAARGAMVGDSVTATRASHWRAVSRACPHCAHPAETVEHQLWLCPRWHAVRVRAAAVFSFDISSLISRLGPLTLHALLRPPCPAALASARLVARIPRQLPPLGVQGGTPETAWTDGAASRAGIPGLARAAWAFHVGNGDREACGPVPGLQAAQRAELYAAVQAAAACQDPCSSSLALDMSPAGFRASRFKLRLLTAHIKTSGNQQLL